MKNSSLVTAIARVGRLLFALPLAALCLSGCGNNPYPPGESEKSILFASMGDDPRTLDPTVSYTVTEAVITDVIYPAYFQYNYLKRNPFVLELALGAVQPKREPYYFSDKPGAPLKKGEQWTFRLKPNLKFQDDPCFDKGKGRDITANDIIYSFRRMADPAVACPVLSFFQDKIIGFDKYIANNQKRAEKKQSADYAAPIEGLQVDAKDPLTFRILLNQPYPQLRYLMAMHFTTPLAREAAEKYGKDLARHPVGSGPFMLTDYTPKRQIVLESNPNRRDERYPSEGEPGDRAAGLLDDAGQKLPLVDKVVLSVVREGVTGWNLFLQGYLDSWGVTQENYSQVISRQGQLSEEMKQKGVRLRKSVGIDISYFGFNMNDPVVGGYTPQKRKLRQAISLTIDAQAILDLMDQGNGKTADFIIPPNIFGYEPNYRNPYRKFDPDLVKAKQLLKEAGYPNGIDPKTGDRLTIYYEDAAVTAAGRQYQGLLLKQIEALGINVEARTWRPIIWQDRIDKGQYQFMHYGWLADYPDPENFLFLLYGPNKRPGPNATNYNNPEYNRLFEKMRALDNGPERLAIIRQMRAIATEDCPWIYVSHSVDLGLGYDWVHNSKPNPIANDVFKYRRVDGQTRAQRQREWNTPVYWPVIAVAAVLILGSIPAANTVKRHRTRRIRREPSVLIETPTGEVRN